MKGLHNIIITIIEKKYVYFLKNPLIQYLSAWSMNVRACTERTGCYVTVDSHWLSNLEQKSAVKRKSVTLARTTPARHVRVPRGRFWKSAFPIVHNMK